MKTQLEEAKRIEEVLKEKLDEKAKQCENIEKEVVGLRNTSEKSNACMKFRINSVILNEILDYQISPLGRSGLGYNSGKEISIADTWKPSKYEAIPSFSKNEGQDAPHVPAKNKEELKRPKKHQGVSPTPQIKFRKDTS